MEVTMKKPTPEDRERIRRVIEQGREARREFRETLERLSARRLERQKRSP